MGVTSSGNTLPGAVGVDSSGMGPAETGGTTAAAVGGVRGSRAGVKTSGAMGTGA
jgi:hypothetical protein